MERVTGIGPVTNAWEALVLPLNYTRKTLLILYSLSVTLSTVLIKNERFFLAEFARNGALSLPPFVLSCALTFRQLKKTTKSQFFDTKSLIFERRIWYNIGMEHYGFVIEDILSVNEEKLSAKETVATFDLLFFENAGGGVLTANGKKHKLSVGDFTYLPKGTQYKRTFENAQTIVVAFTLTGAQNPVVTTFATQGSRWREYLSKALDIWSKKQTGYYYKSAVLLTAVFGFVEAQEQSLSRYQMADRLKETVDECFTDPTFCINELAVKFNVSEVYIRKLFKDAFALSPKEYLQQKRLDYACNLLKCGLYRVGHIAQMCGFGDEKYFSTAFKKEKGVTPKAYAKEEKE